MRTQDDRRGAMLVAAIIVLMSVAVVGVSLLSLATSARYQRVNYGIGSRAYYLAESGISFVQSRGGVVTTNVTCMLSNGDQFELHCEATNFVYGGMTNRGSMGWTVGIVNPGTRLEAKRALVFNMRQRLDSRILDLGFDNNSDGVLDSDWKFTSEGSEGGNEGAPRIATPPEGGQALEMQNWMGNFQLNWSSNPDLDLVMAWSNNYKLMSYDVQAKVSAAKYAGSDANPVFNSALLVGIGFRLQPDKLSSFGVSFYRRHPDSFSHYAPWIEDLDNTFLGTLTNTNLYLVLWKRQYPGKREVIAYKKLGLDMLYPSPMKRRELDLRPFSTILVSLKEEYVGMASNRINRIKVYMQSPTVYPRWPDGIGNYVYAKWPGDVPVFPQPVAWDNLGGSNMVSSTLFTSERFNVLKPPEISLHVYDYAVKYFDDFVMRVDGFVRPGMPGDQIQY